MEQSKLRLLFFILVDKVREGVLEWTSSFKLPQLLTKYYLVPSAGEQEGHAALFHLLFLLVLMQRGQVRRYPLVWEIVPSKQYRACLSFIFFLALSFVVLEPGCGYLCERKGSE